MEVEITDQGILLRPKKVIDSTQAWFWTPSWQAGEARAEKEIRQGRTTVHESTEDLLTALDED